MNTSWQPIGKINPEDLTEARLQLHYAVQFIAAPGLALAEPQPDYSHTSLEWRPEIEAFVGKIIAAEKPFRVALNPVNQMVKIADADDVQDIQSAPLSLDKITMEQGLQWLKEQVAQRGADADKVVWIDYPKDDFPYHHPLAYGAVFDVSQKEAFQELVNYYANSHFLLSAIASKTEGASEVRTWPHHFDIATLITLPKVEGKEQMYVGVGMSPGDNSYNQPYWYVAPYPSPTVENLPQLEGNGFWHKQGWVGAVLTASNLVEPNQQQQVQTFLDSAISASRNLLMS